MSSGACIFVLHAHQLLSHSEFLSVLLLKSKCFCFSDIGCECRFVFFFQYFKMYSANTDIEFKFGISVLKAVAVRNILKRVCCLEELFLIFLIFVQKLR